MAAAGAPSSGQPASAPSAASGVGLPPDVVGDAQEQLRAFFKAYADTVWEVQQLTEYDAEKVRARRPRDAGV
jgi:hypothetical protein